jgi:23S rRNA pseudouridine2605 synthase
MDFENEKKFDEKPATEQNTGSREGYPQAGNGFQRDYRGRSPRPRIHTGQRPAYNNGDRPSFNRQNNDEGGFRPEGFGAGLQSSVNRQQGGYRPRNNYNSQGGYGQQRQGGYGYNNRGGQGGYQPRQQQGGYQPRQQQGGYRPRYGSSQQQGGYRPRYGNGQQQGGYQSRQQGGYQSRQQGGYNPYGGGYRQQRTPGYNPNAKYSMKKRIEYKEEHVDPNEPIRLNKFLANAGVCSRREADDFIQAGVVLVNGEVVKELGTKVKRSDTVIFHDQPVTLEKKVYVLLNKPKDTVTTSDDPQQRKTVMDLVKDACPERIYPVGRLDRNTTGVLLLTNDGDLASKLTHPKFLKKKVYHVYLDKNVTAHDIQQIAEGITLDDGEVHADAIAYASDTDKSQVGIEIHSGKNRIVRRIFESLGYRVVKLDRVQFAGLTKKSLRRGDWRFLTEKEVEMLRMGAFE